MKALVVDDEKLIVKGLKFSLEQEGYEVDCAYDGQEAVDKCKEKEYDIVLLDLMLPILSGYEVCQQVREFSDMPIIMLTAKGDDMDKILGLEYGADDYITKPFNILEVKARINAIIRRNKKRSVSVPQEPKVIISGKMKLDIEAKRLYIEDIEIKLTVKEFDILKLLAENPGKIYSREQLLTIIWGSKYPGDARTVDVNVRRLREKIEENPAKPEYVHTKWGMGYYFQG
ncbi:MAG: response regulator transcription factor [Eubacterium sp.]